VARGPASAFELVVSMREFKEELTNFAQAQSIAVKNAAHGDALSEIASAEAYRSERVAKAHGEADRLIEMTKNMKAEDTELMKRKLLYEAAKDLFDPVNKIIVDPRVSDVVIIQNTEKNSGGFKPPGN
jgi:membrane protease subunit HflK